MWNGPPISNIPPAHQVGNEILQQLLLLPQVLPRKPIDASTAIILGKSARSGREQVASIQKDVDALERILRVYEEEVVDSNTGPRKKRKGHS